MTIPDATAVQKELSGLFTIVYTGLESALLETKEFFGSKKRAVDRYLAPNLVRYATKLYLAERGKKATEEEAEDFDLQNLPSNGLCLEYGKFNIRILKSDDGSLPVPGPSKKRQAFWNQHQLKLYEPNPDSNEAQNNEEPRVNLIVLWDVDGNYNLSKVSLVCPRTGAEKKDSVSDYWTVDIPHPVVTHTPETVAPVQNDEDDIVSLKRKLETGTEEAQ